MGYNFIYTLIVVAVQVAACSSIDPALTLAIPQQGFEVVQQIPPNATGRDTNALYLPPRRVSKKEFGSPELDTYIDSMYAVMLRTGGVGIASNQLGKRLQIFMIEAESDNPRYQILGSVPMQVFINPRITKVSEKRMNFWHGCLSAKDSDRGNVATYEWIEYECQDREGELKSGRLDGFAAVIFQHEFRHMMGGTYLDHARHFVPKHELDRRITSGDLPFFELASDTLPLLIEGYSLGESLDEYHARMK